MRSMIAIVCLVFVAACVTAEQGDRLDIGPYGVYEDAASVAETAIAEAREEGKLALIILGGNWCHDSKSLAKRIKGDELADLMGAAYVTRLISVGFLDNEGADEIAARYTTEGAYLATPTVLIIEPKTGVMVNRDDHVQFRDAFKLSDEEVEAYFEKYTDQSTWSELPQFSDDLGQAPYVARLAAIDREFRAPNVARLLASNEVLGPMLKTRARGLDANWYPVRDFRYGFGDDLRRLREELAQQQAAGTLIFSAFPTYPPFPWAHTEAATDAGEDRD